MAELPQLTYEEAREIAFRAAKAFRPSYFTGDDFEPHPWVVHAVISATNAGQRAAAKGRDLFSRNAGVLGTPAVEEVDCAMCRGVGRHGTPGAHCSWCDGTGKKKRLTTSGVNTPDQEQAK